MYEPTVEFPGPTPQLVVSDAAGAIRFYQDVFCADELVRNHAPDGRVVLSELLVCGGRLLVIDEFEPDPLDSPTRLGGTTVRLHLYVPNVDATYVRAVEFGATGLAEPEDRFWGDRYAMIRDPYGHLWSLATPVEEFSVAEQAERSDAWNRRYGMDIR